MIWFFLLFCTVIPMMMLLAQTWRSYRIHVTQCDHTCLVGQLPVTAEEAKQAIDYAIDAYPPRAAKQDAEFQFRETLHKKYGTAAVAFNSSGIDGFTLETDEQFVISFRGTAGWFDVLKDLCAIPKRTKAGYSHRGFYNDAITALKLLGLSQRIETAIGNGKKLTICGHSYGAALAIEFAGLVIEYFGSEHIALVCALCAPRSSNKSRARWIGSELENKVFRVSFSRDIVPMLPPAGLYEHVGNTHYFDRNEEYHPLLTVGYRLFDVAAAIVQDLTRLRILAFLTYHSAVRVRELARRAIDAGMIGVVHG